VIDDDDVVDYDVVDYDGFVDDDDDDDFCMKGWTIDE
jgi:hypothetical protein